MQRRTRMIVIGSILLTAYAGWMYQVVPWLERIPDNFYYSSDIVSIDNFFDHNAQAYEGPIYSKTRFYYGISGKKDNDVLLIRNVFDVRTPDGKPIISIEREYGVNAKTGKHVKGFGDKNREGYLFAPRRLRKGKSFTHWHINYDGPAEMEYVRDEELYGLTVRLYKANYNNVPIDQTQDLEYIPGVGTEYGIELEPHLQLWVEPITGQIVKYADDTIAYYYDLKTHERLWPWNHFTNVVSEQSVEKNVQNAYTTRVQWRLISTVSIILLLAGLWILSAATGCIRIFQQHTSLNGFAWLFGMSAITTASFILLQWSIGKIWLSLPIQPITAACIILLAGSYLLRTKFRGILSLAMSTILVVITGIFLAEFLFGLPVFIDHFLLPHHAQTSDAPQRMSLYCALCFFLLGLVPLVAPIRALRPLRLLHILPLSVALLSLFAILTVLLDIHSAYISTFFASVQLLSAIVFLCFSIIMHGMYWESSYKTLWSKQWLVMSSILFGCISTTIIFTGLASQSFANDAKVSFDLQINNATNAIAERLHIYINALEGGIGLFESSDRVEREEFYTYVTALKLQKNYPGILALGYSEFIEPQDLKAHTDRIRSEGFPSYQVYPEGNRTLYTAIIYIEPFTEQNQQAFGYDMFQQPVRHLAMERARDTGLPQMSGLVTLKQEIDKDDVQPGFLIYLPLYAKDMPKETREERRTSIIGYVYAPFRAHDFVNGALSNVHLRDISVRVDDGTVLSPEHTLYNDSIHSEDSPRFTANKTLYVAGRPWTLTFSSTPDFGVTAWSRLMPFVIMLVGLILSAMLAALFTTLISSHDHAVAYADAVTKELKEAKAKDEAMLSSIGDGLFALDKDANIILMNSACEEHIGWNFDEIGHRNIYEILHMQDESGQSVTNKNRPINHALTKGNIVKTNLSTIFYYLRKDGTRFPVIVTVTPIRRAGEIIGAIEVFRNVSKELEMQKVQEEFVSLASHQLRTPVSALRWACKLIEKEGSLTNKQQKTLRNMHLYVKQLAGVVSTFLRLANLEELHVEKTMQSTDLSILTQESYDECASATNHDKIQFTIQPTTKKILVYTDAQLLKEVLCNLMSNAFRYTPEGGSVTVSIHEEENQARWTITDTGCGISNEDQKKLFSKYFRAHNAKKIQPDGTGIGLYIVKNLVEKLHGTITVQSEEGKGTTFVIHLPLA